MADERWGYVRIEDHLDRWLERVKDSPAAKRKATMIVNREGEKVLAICREIADEELHRRDDPSRRSPESNAHGKHLHDSFYVVPARENDYKPILRIGNDHPAFPYIEKGTKAHSIAPRGDHPLAFPFNGGARGGVGRKGAFAVNWDEGEPMFRDGVDHPGVEPRNILGRALRRYRRRAQKHRIS